MWVVVRACRAATGRSLKQAWGTSSGCCSRMLRSEQMFWMRAAIFGTWARVWAGKTARVCLGCTARGTAVQSHAMQRFTRDSCMPVFAGRCSMPCWRPGCARPTVSRWTGSSATSAKPSVKGSWPTSLAHVSDPMLCCGLHCCTAHVPVLHLRDGCVASYPQTSWTLRCRASTVAVSRTASR